MTLPFPDTPSPIDGSNVVNGILIDRTWQYSPRKNRWELVGFDSTSFEAEAPIKQYGRDGNIVTDYDIQDLEEL